MLQLCKLSNTGLKPACLVLRIILKHDPTSHLATVRASDSVMYFDIARVISLRIIYYYYIIVGRHTILYHTILYTQIFQTSQSVKQEQRVDLY